MNILKKNKPFFSVLILITVFLTSCSDDKGCKVEGTIKGAANGTLYFYKLGEKGYIIVDSAAVGSDGSYSVSLQLPESFAFYKMQLGRSADVVTFVVDSENTINISGEKNNLTAGYTVAGSTESQKVKELNDIEANLAKQVRTIIDSNFDNDKKRASIVSLINEYKIDIREKYITPSPGSASAYYALFLKLRVGDNAAGECIFQPASVGFDNACLQEVAKGVAAKYPGTKRADELSKRAKEINDKIESDKCRSEGFKNITAEYVTSFEINLPQMNGDSIALSSLADKVVLLDFTELDHVEIGLRNAELRQLYDKYHKRGFEIYQIAYDEDENAWKAAAKNLPWVSVHDNFMSMNLRNYNVQSLPTYFILGKGNELLYRDVDVKDLSKTIEELLKK